jgi:hypothetical protein
VVCRREPKGFVDEIREDNMHRKMQAKAGEGGGRLTNACSGARMQSSHELLSGPRSLTRDVRQLKR